VRDLPLAPLGAWIARRVGCPLIIDMAEPYPEALRSNWLFDNLGGLDHLTRNPRLADAVERWVVAPGPRTIVVSQEAGERLERVGLPAGRWTLVGNTPDLPRTRQQAKQPAEIPESFRDRKILIFTGILVGDRGVEVALRGLKQLQASTPDRFGLLVIGDGPARSQLEAEARTLGVDTHVSFMGWIPHDDLPAYWARAEIGILPFHACTHIDTTLANKLFDYMAVGLPVVTSDARPMARVLRETGAGLTFAAGNPDSFARAVRTIADDPDRAGEMRRGALEASDRTYNWARDAEHLLEAVEQP
jgi:glycosyltransferase involved in cell wall biosynthesis